MIRSFQLSGHDSGSFRPGAMSAIYWHPPGRDEPPVFPTRRTGGDLSNKFCCHWHCHEHDTDRMCSSSSCHRNGET